jgi:hypothetical protein
MLDGVIAVLLVMTIVWCILLNRRLVGLRRHQNELNTLIGSLNEATVRAEAGIAALKDNAEKAGADLKSSIEQAERLNDDLNYLSQRSSRLAQRLETTPQSSQAPSAPQEVDLESHERSGPNPARRRMEQELLNALRAAR